MPRIDLAFAVDPPAPPEPAAPQAVPPPAPLTDGGEGESAWTGVLEQWMRQLRDELPADLQAPAYSLGLQLVDDERMAALNQTWRGRSGPTDVLAFAAMDEPMPMAAAQAEPLELGDIVISLDTARRQAEEAGHSLRSELLFLASHGLLHLLGWDHPDEIRLNAMLERQRRLIEAD